MNNPRFKIALNSLITIAVAHLVCLPASAQVSKEVLESISTPDQVETSIGPLEPWIEKTWRPGEIELVK